MLHRALEGLRFGVQPTLVAEARVGEMIETLWDGRDREVDPLVVRVFVEALRVLRRAPHAETVLAGEASEQEAFGWQMSRLAALEPVLAEYLADAPAALRAGLPRAPAPEQREMLLALLDLRAETAPVVLPLLAQPRFPTPSWRWRALSGRRPAGRAVPARLRPAARAGDAARPTPSPALAPPRPSVPPDLPYRSLLRALRACPGKPTEDFLLTAAQDWDPTYRAAALSSLGWWEPMQRKPVLRTLQEARRDANPDVRQAARAALARLGERQALQWFRQTLTSEDPHRIHEAIQAVAVEGLTLLWPDLDRLADAEDEDVAQLAREALERMCEEMDLGGRERK